MRKCDIDDPSDWPKEFPELKNLDSLLRCSICFDYFDIAVILLQCSHNYCSRCIRQHIAKKKHCPSCGISVLESHFSKPNRVLDELVKNFRHAKKILLQIIKGHDSASLERIVDQFIGEERNSQDEEFEEPASFRTPKSANKTLPTVVEQNKCVTKNSEDSAPCPVCLSIEPISMMNKHLDVCLTKKRNATSPMQKCSKRARENGECSSSGVSIGNETRTEGIEANKNKASNDLIKLSNEQVKRKLLQKIPFEALPLNKLRKHAEHYGLSKQGDNNTLVKRLQNYHWEFDAQCDSANPLSADEVAKKVMQEEEALRIHGYVPKMMRHDRRHTDEEKSEFDKAYSKEHDSHFQTLINDIKRRKAAVNQKHDSRDPVNELGNEIIDILSSREQDNDFVVEKTCGGEHVFGTTALDEHEKDGDHEKTVVQTQHEQTNRKRKTTKIASTKSSKTSKKKRTDNRKQSENRRMKDISSFFKTLTRSVQENPQLSAADLNACELVDEDISKNDNCSALASDSDDYGVDSDADDHDEIVVPDSPTLFNPSKFNSTATSTMPLNSERRVDVSKPELSPIAGACSGRQSKSKIVEMIEDENDEDSELSHEISMLVDRAMCCDQNEAPTSDSDATLSENENVNVQDVVPMPPSDLNFTGFDLNANTSN